MHRRNIRIGIWVTCGLSLLIFLGVRISDGFKRINNSFAEDLPSTYSIPSEDSNLIAKKYWPILKVDMVIRSKNRGPISFIFFGNGYHLVTYKIDLTKGAFFKDAFRTDIESVDRTTGAVYKVINHNDLFEFQCEEAQTKPVSNIYLTLAGDSLKNLIKNDSIMNYHLLCKNFSIRYAQKDPIDIFVVGKEGFLANTSIIPMDLLFLKRDDAVYLLMMTPNDLKSTIAPDLLYNVVMGI